PGIEVRQGARPNVRWKVSGKSVDTGKQWRGETGSANLEPPGRARVCAGIDRGARGRVRDRRHVCDRPTHADGIRLPWRLGLVKAASAAAAGPGGLRHVG